MMDWCACCLLILLLPPPLMVFLPLLPLLPLQPADLSSPAAPAVQPTWICEVMVARGNIHEAIEYVKQIESEIQKAMVIE